MGSGCGPWSRRGARRLLLLLCMVQLAGAVRRSFRRNKSDVPQSEKNKVMYIFLAIFLSCMCVCCVYICNRICPQGPIFAPLELDDIRIGRVMETENTLQQQIEGLQTRLTLQRMKRTNLETSRDIAATVEDRVEQFNSKGQQIYGDAWDGKDGGSIPIKELITIPDDELRQMRVEAQNIVTARKAEEERDLWKIWNQYKDDGASKKAGEGQSNQTAHSSAVSTATGQPDVLTGRAHRATKATAAVSDPRFGSSHAVAAAPAAPTAPKALPPPRSYEAPPPQQGRAGPRPPPPISAGPGRGLPSRVPISRPPREESAGGGGDSKIHSSFHSPPPRSGAERAPLLAHHGESSGGAGSRPPPPSGPPPGWKGGAPPAPLAPLTAASSGATRNVSANASTNAAAASSGGTPLSPPLAPAGVLPPRGTPPPASLKYSSAGRSKKAS